MIFSLPRFLSWTRISSILLYAPWHLNRVCILLLLSVVFYKFWLHSVSWWSCSILADFLYSWLSVEGSVLKSLACGFLNLFLQFYHFLLHIILNFVSFVHIKLLCFLHKFSLYVIQIIHCLFISDNFTCSKTYLVWC